VADEIKTGAYICKGCGLGERLDCDQLATIAEREGKANIVKQHDFLCNAEGVAMIQHDIDNEGVNKVVIAACSRRAKTEAFNFENVAISRANLREGVIWVRPDDDESSETTQEMAADYVRMGCSEVKFMNLPQANDEAASNDNLLVVGGGVAGMTAALEAAKAGYPVTIVEKSGQLGGSAAFDYKRVPERMPYADPEDTGIAEMISEIEANDRITVHLNSTTTKTSGAPGRFSADISTESGSTTTANFGAIIMASGARNYDASQLPELGYGKSPDVVDQAGLEKLAVEANGGPIKRPSDGKEVEKVVFVQCAGQRSQKEGHLPYCSGHCCLTSIKQAMYFKDQNPQVDTNIIYSDMRTPGAGGEDFYRSGQQKGITFTKGTVSEVTAGGNGLTVGFKDLILDEDVSDSADLVVLATGQVPNSGVDIDLPITEDENVAEAEAAGNAAPEVKVESILNLTYRQGPDLPHLKYGFNDSHFICFPYETRRTGIYSAGPVRRPMDSLQAKEDATGAALKAIQALENAKIGRAAHPRSAAPSTRTRNATRSSTRRAAAAAAPAWAPARCASSPSRTTRWRPWASS
jgi:quinone-modifying oxidoreductase subunit QmoB